MSSATTTTTTMWPWRTVSGLRTNEFLDFHILRHCAAEKEKKRNKKKFISLILSI